MPVIALSQLNRSVEARDGHTPRMSDLRESGSIETRRRCCLYYYTERDYYDHTKKSRNDGCNSSETEKMVATGNN